MTLSLIKYEAFFGCFTIKVKAINKEEAKIKIRMGIMTQATKRPWELITDKDTAARYILGNDGKENVLDALYLSGSNCAEADENAKLIVKAVNCHDEIVETLEAIKARILGEFDHRGLIKLRSLSTNIESDILELGGQALKKASK